MKYGILFTVIGAACATFAVLDYPMKWLWMWLFICSVFLMVVYFGNRPLMFGKRPDGTLNPLIVAVFFPLFALNYSARWMYKVIRPERPVDEVIPGLWIGRRPQPGDVPDSVKVIVDLTSEFHEIREVRTNYEYHWFPVLDQYAPTPEELATLVRKLSAVKEPMLVHCAVGHGRSAMIVAAILMDRDPLLTLDDAISMVRAQRPAIFITKDQREAILASRAI